MHQGYNDLCFLHHNAFNYYIFYIRGLQTIFTPGPLQDFTCPVQHVPYLCNSFYLPCICNMLRIRVIHFFRALFQPMALSGYGMQHHSCYGTGDSPNHTIKPNDADLEWKHPMYSEEDLLCLLLSIKNYFASHLMACHCCGEDCKILGRTEGSDVKRGI